MVSTRNLKPKFSIGEKVLCYEPDPLKAKVLYNSKVLKILDDKEGKRGIEFLIHFSGWNSTWDRYVTEDFILKDTEENRKLQQELAERAQLTPGGNLYRREQRRSSKKHHHPHYRPRKTSSSSSMSPNPYTEDNNVPFENGNNEPARGNENSRGNELSRPNHAVDETRVQHNPDETSSASDRTDTMSSCSDSENINIEFPSTCRGVNPALPLNHFLHTSLVSDHVQVKQNNMVVSLPASPNVIEILDSFYRHYAAIEINAFPNRTPSTNENSPPTLKDLMKSLNSLIHIVDGVRIYFDFSLKQTLLYNNEHKQFDFYKNNFQRNNSTYRNMMREDINITIKKEAGVSSPIKKESISLHNELVNSAYKKEPFSSLLMRDALPNIGPKDSLNNKEGSNSLSSQDHVRPIDRLEPFSEVEIKHEVESAYEDDYEPNEKKAFLMHETTQDRKSDIRSYSPNNNTSSSNRRDRLVEKVLNSTNVLSCNNVLSNTNVLSSLSNNEGNVLSNHNNSEHNILSNHSNDGGHQRMDSISSVDSTMSGRTSSSISSAGGTAPYLAHWDQTRSSLLERLSQWEFVPDNILQASPPLPSAVYGAVHLTRLFVKLPNMLANSVLTDEKIEYILEVVQDLAEYVSEHEEWFRPNIYVNNTF
ncbi:hypothetical protein WDU94_013329 [Cyamophila willieti]